MIRAQLKLDYSFKQSLHSASFIQITGKGTLPEGGPYLSCQNRSWHHEHWTAYFAIPKDLKWNKGLVYRFIITDYV